MKNSRLGIQEDSISLGQYAVPLLTTRPLILSNNSKSKTLFISKFLIKIPLIYHRYIKWGAKLTVDFAVALIGIFLTSPLFILIPILIRLDSPGPLFYLQERTGKNRRRGNGNPNNRSVSNGRCYPERRRSPGYGRPFKIIKFRTMCHDAEKESGPVWAVKNDPRVTRAGHYLRAIRLDELPQLFNVLRGEMSLVGPRPERPFFVEKLVKQIPNYDARFLVRPGVTGLAQIMQDYSGSVNNIRRKISHDIEYVRNLKLLRDLIIILRTVVVVLTAKGG